MFASARLPISNTRMRPICFAIMRSGNTSHSTEKRRPNIYQTVRYDVAEFSFSERRTIALHSVSPKGAPQPVFHNCP
jgi:hypothetical protein